MKWLAGCYQSVPEHLETTPRFDLSLKVPRSEYNQYKTHIPFLSQYKFSRSRQEHIEGKILNHINQILVLS